MRNTCFQLLAGTQRFAILEGHFWFFRHNATYRKFKKNSNNVFQIFDILRISERKTFFGDQRVTSLNIIGGFKFLYFVGGFKPSWNQFSSLFTNLKTSLVAREFF